MKIIDLSVAIHSGMDVYPGDPEPQIDIVHTYAEHSWELRRITMGTHTGTHVDAFSHMHEKGKTLDDIPLNRFCGQAVALDNNDPLPRHTGLLFRFRIDTDLLDPIVEAKPPFVGGEISEDLERALLREEIVTYTNLVNLDLLPTGSPFLFIGFPLKISKGDGSPVRAVAIIDFNCN